MLRSRWSRRRRSGWRSLSSTRSPTACSSRGWCTAAGLSSGVNMENIYFKPVNLLKTELDNFKNRNINTYNLVEKDKNYSKSLLPFVKFRVIFQLNSLSENIFHFYVKCNIDSIFNINTIQTYNSKVHLLQPLPMWWLWRAKLWWRSKETKPWTKLSAITILQNVYIYDIWI